MALLAMRRRLFKAYWFKESFEHPGPTPRAAGGQSRSGLASPVSRSTENCWSPSITSVAV
jgi:hypothetical protein